MPSLLCLVLTLPSVLLVPVQVPPPPIIPHVPRGPGAAPPRHLPLGCPLCAILQPGAGGCVRGGGCAQPVPVCQGQRFIAHLRPTLLVGSAGGGWSGLLPSSFFPAVASVSHLRGLGRPDLCPGKRLLHKSRGGGDGGICLVLVRGRPGSSSSLCSVRVCTHSC